MSASETTRRVLSEHGLPPGLLPGNVREVHHDPTTGAFTVLLAAKVDRQITKYPVHYKVTISGVLEVGRVGRLAGVQVKKGLWIPVSAIEAAGDHLVFVVGPIRKSIPVSAFETR